MPLDDDSSSIQSDSESDQSDNDSEDDVDWSQKFVDFLLTLRSQINLSAKNICTLSFFAHKAGLSGEVAQLAFRPDAPTGHYQRHLDAYFNFTQHDELLSKIDMPMYDRKNCVRTTLENYCLPPHITIPEELSNIDSELDVESLPNAYHDNPYVMAEPNEIFWPLALYVDGTIF